MISNKPSMFSLISKNNISGATTIKQASQGHRFPTNRCNNCTCSPGLLSRNSQRSSVYLKRLMSNSHPGGRSQRRSTSRSSSVNGSPGKSSIKDVNTSLRLESIRQLMEEKNLGVYIIPSEDAHQSEYTSSADKRREFISGFTGSAGVAVITRELGSLNEDQEGLACIATDGRYFTQATNELDYNWTLLKLDPSCPSWEEWAVDQAALLSLDSGETVNIGVDPKLITYEHVSVIQKLIDAKNLQNSKYNISLVPLRDNLVDLIWPKFEKQPEKKFRPVFKLEDEFTGETTQSKLERLNNLYFKKHGSDTMIINSLDEIAWLLNLRGDDIKYNPLFYGYLVINSINNLTLYTNDHERFVQLQDYLKEINCSLKKYDEIWFDIRKLASSLHSDDSKKILLTNETTWKMVNCIIAKNYTLISSPIKAMKEIKNEIELEGQKKAQIDDGFALIKYFAWLERQVLQECQFVSEYEAAMELLKIRTSLPNFMGLSFETISATGPNSAIIHYTPTLEGSAIINPEKVYLCDSGSQFLSGTTDTTRTLHFGKPSEDEIRNYTLVLKGHIALARLTIPDDKVTGYQVDCIARQFLWSHGLDYQHGTGHGVDAYGPVHSSGVGIGFRPYCNESTLKKGQLISDEPGCYKPNEYGIRIENMVFLKEKRDIPGFLEFETTTTVPYCKKLINVGMLSSEEKSWINEYHAKIWQLYEGKLQHKSWERQWLKRETSAI